MLVEPSTLIVVPLGSEEGSGKEVGVGDCAHTGPDAKVSDQSLGVAASANAIAVNLIKLCLEDMSNHRK